MAVAGKLHQLKVNSECKPYDEFLLRLNMQEGLLCSVIQNTAETYKFLEA